MSRKERKPNAEPFGERLVFFQLKHFAGISFAEKCASNFIYCASKTTLLRPRTPFAVRLMQER